jgi:hypothetical protein
MYLIPPNSVATAAMQITDRQILKEGGKKKGRQCVAFVSIKLIITLIGASLAENVVVIIKR